MNHFIWLTDINDKALYLLASSIQAFTRHDNGHTIIQLTNGTGIFVKSRPEEIEKRMNTYYNDLLTFMNNRNNGLI